jgi:deoxyribonucleoside regulator
VVSTAGVLDEQDLTKRTAQAAADYLTALRPVPRTLGISWGRTLHDISVQLRPGWASGVDVVQINGDVSLNARPGTAAVTAVSIAQNGAGQFTLLPSPAILERVETKRAIATDRSVAAVLEMGSAASAYLFSAGQADAGSAHVESGYLTPDQVAELVRKGAVGDIVGRFIDSAGQIVDPALNERTLGIPLGHLRRSATAIAVIGGARKHANARSVVLSGLCTVLITDEDTAQALLAREP